MTMPYTRISNSIIQDKTLSYGATGLFCYMLSMPTGWKFNIQHLSMQKRDKRFRTRQLLKELESPGLVEKKRITNQQGRVTEWHFQLNPKSNFRILDTIPESNFQIVGNQPQSSLKSPESNLPEVEYSRSGKLDTINNTKRETIQKNKGNRSKSFKTYSLYDFEKEVEICAKDKGMSDAAKNKFIDHWAERDDKGRMRFQHEKTWETGRRISKWMSNNFGNHSAAVPSPEVNPMIKNAKTPEQLAEIFGNAK